MEIREMSREECLRVLAGARLARLACTHENQPYIVPVYLAYDKASGCLCGFTTPGQKIEWMRANPLVCVEVDEIATYDQWVSIIVMGHYEELPETTGNDEAPLRAPERVRHFGGTMPPWSADSLRRPGDDEEYAIEGSDDERERAWQVLKTLPEWWQPGSAAWAARPHRDPAEPCISVFYRIRIDHVTGHEATRDPGDALSYAAPAPPARRRSWLCRTLFGLFGWMKS
jgi:uncharacterized protein